MKIGIALVAAIGWLAFPGCRSAGPGSGADSLPAAREGEPVPPAPAVPGLAAPAAGILAAQAALGTLPPGLVRAADGRLFAERDGSELVLVPAGAFTMGDSGSGEADEGPARRVRLSAFLLDRHEVTNAQFARFVAATGHRTDAEVQGIAHALVGDAFRDVEGADWRHPGGPGTSIEGRDDHPVVLVSWNDASAYAAWAGRRLPTEAEFEMALRGGVEGAKYPWGDGDAPPPRSVNLSDDAARRAHGRWIAIEGYEDGFPTTAPVGSFPANALGLFDASGNVWEWCGDWFAADAYARSPEADPRGPESGEKRVSRGGGWDGTLFAARCACRDRGTPGLRLPYLGFRTAVAAGTPDGNPWRERMEIESTKPL